MAPCPFLCPLQHAVPVNSTIAKRILCQALQQVLEKHRGKKKKKKHREAEPGLPSLSSQGQVGQQL